MEITLIFPHQLFKNHPAVAKGREIQLIEDPLFIGDYTPFFLRNPRLSMMARSWQKMSPEKQAAHRSAADGFLERLG